MSSQMMFHLDGQTDIEYVDNMWLHVHTNFGMYSAHIKPEIWNAFLNFLTNCLAQKDNTEEWVALGEYKFGSETEEDHFNIYIDNAQTRIIISIELTKLRDFIRFFRQQRAAVAA